MEKDSKKEEQMDMRVERQKFQMHQKGYNDIVEAIKAIPKTEIELPEYPEYKPTDMTETNNILSKLVDAVKEDITIELVIK